MKSQIAGRLFKLIVVALTTAAFGIQVRAGEATSSLRGSFRNAVSLTAYKTILGHQPSIFFRTSDSELLTSLLNHIDFIDPDVSNVSSDEFLVSLRPSVCTYILEIERADHSRLQLYVYHDYSVLASESLHPKYVGVLSLTSQSRHELKEAIEVEMQGKHSEHSDTEIR